MFKSITLRSFPETMPTIDRLALAQQYGYEGIEINLEPNTEITLEISDQDLERLLLLVKSFDLKVSGVYSRTQWYYPISSLESEVRVAGRKIISTIISAAEILECDTALVIPGVVDNSIFATEPEIIPYLDAYKNSVESIQILIDEVLSKSNVHIALENVWGKFLYSPMEFASFVDGFGTEQIGVYFDVGNSLRNGFPEDWIRILDHRIRAVHIKDFKRSIDTINGFCGILQGDVNWDQVSLSLQEIGYKRWITGEVLPAYKFLPEILIEETSRAMSAVFQI